MPIDKGLENEESILEISILKLNFSHFLITCLKNIVNAFCCFLSIIFESGFS